MDKLTLASALGKLDEGAECITRERSAGFHELKITKGGGCYHKWSRHDGNSHFFVEDNNSTPLDNWQVYYEPKFKVGDVAIYDSNKLVFVGEFNRSTDSYDLYELKDYIGNTNLSCGRDRESELVLLMAASEFESKIKEALANFKAIRFVEAVE